MWSSTSSVSASISITARPAARENRAGCQRPRGRRAAVAPPKPLPECPVAAVAYFSLTPGTTPCQCPHARAKPTRSFSSLAGGWQLIANSRGKSGLPSSGAASRVLRLPHDRPRAVLPRARHGRRGRAATRAPEDIVHPWCASLQMLLGWSTGSTDGPPRPQAPSLREEPQLPRRVRDIRADASRRRRGRNLDAVRRRARVTMLAEQMQPMEFSRLMNRF